ncbi:uncharacterized protein EV420DRAFT_1519481 [Desarmillaria tabescens]|uniref:F-box domain-containing protein n=1 Tax=Armillaria tabescens TaxID=1929756 RepID=A0AA39NDL6_ARMTA|nr:uncharacterized protein EV420DRAFT_1519481 [Desarmillaria tabescens]KAK0463682.1 hypothetical protein EV420DRAFT_1519481 [Desarmillaria tabescens]
MLSPQLLCAMVVLSCSLICRSWVQRSHRRYLRTTHISSAAQAGSFLRLISGCLSFIGAPGVQALVVGMDEGHVQDWCWEWLPRMLERLPGVKALTFLRINYAIHTALQWYPTHSGRDEGFFAAPVSLAPASLRMTTLKLVGCHFFSLRQLFLVLSQFMLVEDLTLERLQFRNPEPHPFISTFRAYRHIQHLVYLRKLRIDTLDLNPSRDKVSSYIAFTMPSVEVLSLRMRGSLVELEWIECGDMEEDWDDIELRLNLVQFYDFAGPRPNFRR